MIRPFHHPKLNGALPVQELPRYLSIYTPTSCFSGCAVLHSFEVSTSPLKHLPKFKVMMNFLDMVQVMCPTCLCTGMALASEHDPRIDPFQ